MLNRCQHGSTSPYLANYFVPVGAIERRSRDETFYEKHLMIMINDNDNAFNLNDTINSIRLYHPIQMILGLAANKSIFFYKIVFSLFSSFLLLFFLFLVSFHFLVSFSFSSSFSFSFFHIQRGAFHFQRGARPLVPPWLRAGLVMSIIKTATCVNRIDTYIVATLNCVCRDGCV